jgi:multifunctional beta-oxidation protein
LKQAAQAVVNSIKTSGGKAVFHHDENRSGSSPVEAALDSFGHLDILVHITSTKDATTFLAMADPEWRDVIDSQITYAYQCTRAAWPHFRKQKHGSVLFQAWSAGLYGREDQAHICAASHALVGLSATLAAEGKKYNILSNVITLQGRWLDSAFYKHLTNPADREETETRTSLTNRLIVSLGALLVQPARTTESGSTFEISEGRVSKLRWERSKGVLMKTDYTLTPGAVLKFTKKILDFTDAEHATGPIDSFALLDQSKNLDSSPPAPAVCLKGQVAIITGGGAG